MSDLWLVANVICECCGLRFHGDDDEHPYCGPCGRRRGTRIPLPAFEDIDERFFDRVETKCHGQCGRG